MSLPPADPLLPPPPPGRWPHFSEVRGPGRKMALAFLLLISATGFLGMIANVLIGINWLHTFIEYRDLPRLEALNFALQFALDGYVAVSCFALLRSRRCSRSRKSLAILLGLAVLSPALYLGVVLTGELDPGEVMIVIVIITVKVMGPLLALGALLGLQWLPLVEGEGKRPRDGELRPASEE